MTTATYDRLADAAVSARGDAARLYRYGLADPIPAHALKKNADGTVTLRGIDLLKAGTFKGLGIADEDLDAIVAHFRDLRDRGIFLPPFRLDHSWSVLSVIGWIEDLDVVRREDGTDGQGKAFLRGDVRVTGSVDYTPEQIVAAIRSGSLRNRSSELGAYVTNAGVEFPLVLYGCAFVDIPAVEGLAPVELSRVRLSRPHELVNLTEGNPVPENETPEETPAVETPEEAGEVGTGDNLDPAAGVDSADGSAPDQEAPPVEENEEDPAGEDPAPAGEEEPADPDEEDPRDVELARARAEVAQLRREHAETRLAAYRQAGQITEDAAPHALALLTHDDEDVRRTAGTLLAALPAPVQLGRPRGRVSLSTDSSGAKVSQLIKPGDPASEVGPLWASLSKKEREERQEEYLAWSRHRAEHGFTD